MIASIFHREEGSAVSSLVDNDLEFYIYFVEKFERKQAGYLYWCYVSDKATTCSERSNPQKKLVADSTITHL